MNNPKLTIQEIALIKQNPLEYLKCHYDLKHGWYNGIKYNHDNNNTQLNRILYSEKPFSEDYKLNMKDGDIEKKDSEMMNKIKMDGFEKDSYEKWIYPLYEEICRYQRYGTTDTSEDSILYKMFEEEGWFEDGGVELDSLTEEYIEGTIKDIHNLFDKSEGLSENCILYRGGDMPKDLEIGDEKEFDTFTSATYKMNVGLSFSVHKSHKENMEKCFIKILAPEGTKALIGTSKFTEKFHDNEHEVTLRDGQKYKVVDKEIIEGLPPIVTIALI